MRYHTPDTVVFQMGNGPSHAAVAAVAVAVAAAASSALPSD